ncbi:hypothetical protein [Agilicoccus flavus]|uniref:hypothetical protein n=1 Tax=Agilicoccus flavus TaxID=2775968 RepID=UPI001CF66B7D|nr:hypothetical protein [Agilicoccus flavus]
MWYAQEPRRAARQAIGDALVVGWVLAWVAVGIRLAERLRGLAEQARALARSGEQAESALTQASRDVTELPFVGERLAGAFAALAAPGTQARQAGLDLAADVERLGSIAGAATALAPALALAIPWLVARIAFHRRSGAARRLLATGAEPDLFALRALARAPLTRLRAIHPDPAGAWRRGDPDVVRALADLELAAIGLRIPARAAAATPAPGATDGHADRGREDAGGAGGPQSAGPADPPVSPRR